MELFVPGRMCLFGEHSDWAGSFRRFNSEVAPGVTIVCSTNQGVFARVRKHPSALILTTTTDKGEVVGPVELPMNPVKLLEVAQEGGFWSYAAGVAYKICTDYRVGGLEVVNYRTDLPIRKGLSSSAAFCVLIARAFNRLYDIKMTIRGEMEYAYQGEVSTPSRCGRMDQGCAFGRPIRMTYDGEFVGVNPLVLRGPPLHYVIVDLHGDKSTTEILAGLQAGYPFARTDIAKGVHRLLGPLNQQITTEALKCLEVGDAEGLGRLMKQAQEGWDTLGVPACPSQLTAPLLHKVLEYPAIQPLIWGGKGVGSQGDGTAQLLAKSLQAQQEVMEIIKRELAMDTLALTLAPSSSIRKAVIPCAGFSSSLYPASKTVKTELFPVMDRDGLAKPAILVHVEELLEAGIEDIVIVVCQEDLAFFQRLFAPDPLENLNKLSPAMNKYAKRILEMGSKVQFVVQPRQEGFGHAVWCAREAIGNEPFLLTIGHHFYRSTSQTSVTAQMIAAYAKHDCSIVSLQRTPLSQVHRFGTVTGTWIHEDADKHKMIDDGPDELTQALSEVGLGQYVEVFRAEKLLFSQLGSLTAEELKEMRIPLGHRKRLLEAFQNLPGKRKLQVSPAGSSFPKAVRVSALLEKPPHAVAKDKLAMSDPPLPDDTFLTIFGQYILEPDIFAILGEAIAHNVRENGQFQLTSALDRLRQEKGLVGLCVDGQRCNLSNPADYLVSLYPNNNNQNSDNDNNHNNVQVEKTASDSKKRKQ